MPNTLADRASRWVALQAIETFSDTSFSFTFTEKQQLLASPQFFRDLAPYLERSPRAFLRDLVLRRLILPFCEHYAPAIFQRTVEKATHTVLSSLQPTTAFPGKVVTHKLRYLLDYFSVLHGALLRASQETVVTGSLDKHVEIELERAQSLSISTEALYAKALRRVIDLSIESTQELLINSLEEQAFYIRVPSQMALHSIFYILHGILHPLLWLNRAWIVDKIQEQREKDMGSLVLEQVSHPLITPFIRTLDRILEAFYQELKRHPDPARAASLDIHSATFKQLVKQQILMLSLCVHTSQADLKQALESSLFKKLLNEIQDRFALDQIEKSVNGLLSIFWKMLIKKGFIQKQMEMMLREVDQGFITDRRDDTALSKVEQTYKKIRRHLLSSQVHRGLRQTEHRLDKTLNRFPCWPGVKDKIVTVVAGWLGKPIKSAVAERVIPLGMKGSSQAIEELIKFWTISYNLRYGILHYGILLPLIEAK